MFFHQNNYTEIGLDPDTANLVAKVSNQLLDKKSKVLYGTMYANGACIEFGTEKKYQDTHVCLGIDISAMGTFKPSEQTISLDRPDKEDIERFQSERIKQLEREVALARSKS